MAYPHYVMMKLAVARYKVIYGTDIKWIIFGIKMVDSRPFSPLPHIMCAGGKKQKAWTSSASWGAKTCRAYMQSDLNSKFSWCSLKNTLTYYSPFYPRC